ncbi:MAG: hypothetical protein ACI4EX_01735 [Lachnospiraceae bacterium]
MGGITSVINSMELDAITCEIKRTMRRSAKDAVQLGYMLRRVMEEKLYVDDYMDFDSYLQKELQMDYTLANRFIGINKKFSYLGNSMDIAEKYEQYTQGLLIEMLSMTPEQEVKVTPDMTVRQARELKKQDRKPTAPPALQVPEKEEVIIDGEFREIPDKVATSQPEIKISSYGYTKSEYPPDSLIATEGCGYMHECYSCAQDCEIRQKERYCVEAPLGNPFSCTTMNVLENLKDEFGDDCQFINHDMANKRAGDNEPVPCCKKCQEYNCGYRCRRAVNMGIKAEEPKTEKNPEHNPDTIDDLSRLRALLDVKKRDLEEWVKVSKVEEVPENIVYEKKAIVGALANMVCELEDQQDAEPEPEPEQPDLPVLRNNDQRKEWLSKYKDWGLWYRDEHIDVNYYKYDFRDGSRLVVAEYPQRQRYWKKGVEDERYYHLMEKNYKGYQWTFDKKYIHNADSETYLVDFLKNLQKGEK